MKVFAAAVLAVAFSAGAANATLHGRASLRALSLTPPTFRGSGFESHERVTVSLRGLQDRPTHVEADAKGRFLVRFAAAPGCKAWTVRAVGAHSGNAVYRHTRCAALNPDVKGVVRRAPIRNTCGVGDPCSAPAGAVTVQAFEAGSLVADTTTDHNGRFSLALAHGTYTIRAIGRGTKPKTIQIDTANVVRLAFMIDTGIR